MTYTADLPQSIFAKLWFESHEEIADYWENLFKQKQKKDTRDSVVDVLRNYNCTPFEIVGVGKVIPLSKCQSLLQAIGVSKIPSKHIRKVVQREKLRVYVDYIYVYRLVRKTSKTKLQLLCCA
jgi:hypothetical protein